MFKKQCHSPAIAIAAFLLANIFISCEPDELDPSVSDTDRTVSVSLVKTPFIPLVDIKAYDVNYNFSPSYTDGDMISWVKQDGKVIGGKSVKTVYSSDKKIANVYYNEKGVVNTTKSHKVYVGGNLFNEGGDIRYKTELSRESRFYTVAAGTVSKDGEVLKGEISGTLERVDIYNLTGKAIKFRHKGFEARDKWYYQSAEVSMDDHHVENAKPLTKEVASEEISVDAQSDACIYSYYIPTGKKIDNATLIAEIDGKEVRTANTLSSDIKIEINKPYLYVVVWDGTSLRFATEEDIDNPATPDDHSVFDLSDSKTSGVEIVDLQLKEGYMTVSSSRDKMPKKGDILVSGITDKAPFGYMLEVTDVQEVSTKSGNDANFIVSFAGANIAKVLREDYGITQEKVFTIVQEDFISSGDEFSLSPYYADGSFGYRTSLSYKGLRLDVAKKISVDKLEFFIDPSTDDLKFGYEMSTIHNDLIHLKGTASLIKYKEDLYKKFFKGGLNTYRLRKPFWRIPVPFTPIVLTVQIVPSIPLAFSLSTNIDCDLVRNKYVYHSGFKFNTGTGEILYLNDQNQLSYKEDLEGPEKTMNIEADRTYQISLDGKLSFGFGAAVTIGLFGSNLLIEHEFEEGHFLESLGFDLYDWADLVDLDELDAATTERIWREEYGNEWNTTNPADAKSGQALHAQPEYIDDYEEEEKKLKEFMLRGPAVGCDLYCIPFFAESSLGIKSTFENLNGNSTSYIDKFKGGFRAYTTPWASALEFDGLGVSYDLKYEWDPFEINKLFNTRSIIIPAYEKIKIEGYKGMDDKGYVKVSASKYMPIIKKLTETDCGICLEDNGTKEQKLYPFDRSMIGCTGPVSVSIPETDLKSGTKYAVYPYSRLTTPYGTDLLFRDGTFFTYTDGQVSSSTIDDVVGELL